jgi:hypothetical protein
MSPSKFIKGKNLLWLWFFPAALSWSFISAFKPAGRATFWIEVAVISTCSGACGFGLALKSFKTTRQQIFGGLFYTGSSLWLIFSVAFLGCLPIPIVTHQSSQQIAEQHRRLETDMKNNAAKKIPPRDAGADVSMLDLTPFYDSLLPGQGFPETKFFRALQPGTHVFDGIKFDARGMIRLFEVQQVKDIPVGKKCSEIDFLHGSGNRNNSSIASLFVVHFASGHVETVPIVFGQDVGPSYLWRGFEATGMTFTNSVVWEERLSTNAPPRPAFQLFIKKWPNPFPNETVEMIDLIAPQEMSSAFLVAITVRQTDEGKK